MSVYLHIRTPLQAAIVRQAVAAYRRELLSQMAALRASGDATEADERVYADILTWLGPLQKEIDSVMPPEKVKDIMSRRAFRYRRRDALDEIMGMYRQLEAEAEPGEPKAPPLRLKHLRKRGLIG